MLGHLKGGECLVLGDSIIRNVRIECSDIKVECFPDIRTEQLQRVIENRDLGSPDTVVIHVGTNDLRRTGNLDCYGRYLRSCTYGKNQVFNIQSSSEWHVVEARRVKVAYWSYKQQTGVGSKDVRSYFCTPK